MIPIDGALRFLGSQVDNRHVWLMPRGGVGVYCYDVNLPGWVYTDCTKGGIVEADLDDCMIDGVDHQVSQPSTNYFVYVYRDPGTGLGRLDFSATPNGDLDGFVTKSGDPSRRLVGAFHRIVGMNLGSGTNFYTTGSWFNRLTINVANIAIAGYTTATTWTKITDFANRVYAWAWGDGTEHTVSAHGTIAGNAAGIKVYVGISVNDGEPIGWQEFIPAFVGQAVPFAMTFPHLACPGGLQSYDLVMKTDPGGLAGLVSSNAVLTVKVND